jgi:hypothetical protein
VAEQAAKDYLDIIKAGLVWELKREIQLTIEAHYGPDPYPWPCAANSEHRQSLRLDRWRDCDGLALRQPKQHAAQLAAILDCRPFDVEPFIVPACIDGPTKRTIVLDCLRNMGNYARRELAKDRAARRQSA